MKSSSKYMDNFTVQMRTKKIFSPHFGTFTVFFYSARRLNSTFWAVILVFDSWFLVLFLSDIEPYNFVEIFLRKVLRLDILFFSK